MRHAAREPVGVNIALEVVEERRAFLRIHLRLDVEAVDVNRLVAEAVRDFLALDEQDWSSLPWRAFSASTDVRTLWSLSTRN